MMLTWLDETPHFPHPDKALSDPPGLLAAGGALSPEWLLTAYRQGIFPWFSHGEPILWWSPDPRLILEPSNIRISRSLARTLKQQRFDIRCDTAFPQVIAACAQSSKNRPTTWITPQMQRAYTRLHALGFAHSVEAWHEGKLVGGLYGLAIGRVFFGESMFSLMSNASKIALVQLARLLAANDFDMIDCQMTTPHLLSMGAHEIPRTTFCNRLKDAVHTNLPPPALWPEEAIRNLSCVP